MNDIRMIPFSQLTLSPSNARKSASNPAKDKELKASIASQGILQNLVVKPNGAAEQFEVTAGGRRFNKLGELISEKAEGFTEDYPVPCLVKESADLADEASLTENTCREDMDLVDQYEAYQKLHALHGLSVKDLARHFGKSQQDVRKALKLGGVHPELLDQYRARKLDIDDLMAFALEENPDKQLEIFNSLRESGQHVDASAIRQSIAANEITNQDLRVKFIGLQNYKKAGGSTASDIFQNVTYILDETRLDELVAERLRAAADELETEWLWVDVDPSFKSYNVYDFEVLAGEPNPPEELKQELAYLQQKDKAIQEAYDAGKENELDDELTDLAGTIDDKIFELEQKLARFVEHTAEQKAVSGCIVSIDDDGELAVYKGLIDESRIPDDENAGGDAETASEPGAPAKKKAKKKPEEKKLSQALQDDLSRYKHHVAKWSLVLGKNQPGNTYALGYDLVLFQLCYSVLQPPHAFWDEPLSIRATDTSEDTSIKDRESYEVYKQLKHLRADMDLSWLDKNPRIAFSNFCELDSDTKQMLVAYVAAVTLKRECYGEKGGWIDLVLDSQINLLANHWRPTKDNFFKRATKPFLLEAGNHLFDQEWAKRNGAEKKGILAEQLHDRTQEVDSPMAWLPDGMEPELP